MNCDQYTKTISKMFLNTLSLFLEGFQMHEDYF